MRRTPVLAALLAAALIGPVAPSATAATNAAVRPPSVTVHVAGAGGAGIERIQVYAYDYRSDRFVQLGLTDANGDVVAARGRPGHYLGVGHWTVGLYDGDLARDQAGTSYLDDEFEADIKRGVNDLGTRTLVLGGHIDGTLRTPTGRPVADYGVSAESASYGYGISSDDEGRYLFSGLRVGTYAISASAPDQCCGEAAPGSPRVTLADPGDGATQDLVVQPEAPTRRLSGRTPGPGTEVLTYVVSAARYGIADPGGAVTIVVDGDRAHPITQPVDGSRAVVTVSDLSPGSHSFVASYSGPDVIAKRIGITKTVR